MLNEEHIFDYLPDESTLSDAKLLSENLNKQLLMDFWKKSAKIGVYSNNEKRLFENEKYYTSKIKHIYNSKSKKEYIIETKYSIFIVNSNLKCFRIQNEI
jgi:hypothetical protein